MAEERQSGLTAARIEALTDAIFAIAMTLLALSIDIPKPPATGAEDFLRQSLINAWPQLESYLLSFLLLAIFWVVHHRQFHVIRRADTGLLWINIVLLMFVALMPVTTNIMGDYSATQDGVAIFELNLMGIGLSSAAIWFYATNKYRLVDREKIDAAAVRAGLMLSLVTPAVSLLALGVSFISPSRSTMVFLLIPLLLWPLKFKWRERRRL